MDHTTLLPFDIEVAKKEPERVRLAASYTTITPKWLIVCPDNETIVVHWSCDSFPVMYGRDYPFTLRHLRITAKTRKIKVRLFKFKSPHHTPDDIFAIIEDVDCEYPFGSSEYEWVGEAFEREIPA